MANDFSSVAKCIAVYNFEPGALTTDSKGSATLTNYNAATSDAADFKQGSGSADLEDSSQQGFYVPYASLPTTWPLRGTGNTRASYTMWFKMESLGYNTLISMDGNGSPSGFSLVVNAGNVEVYSGNGLQMTLFSGLVAGRWYHIGISFEATITPNISLVARLWDDTAQSYATKLEQLPGRLNLGNSMFCIGCTGNYGSIKSDEFFDGKIDEVAVFTKGLDVTEMAAIQAGTYNSTFWDKLNSNNFADEADCVSVYDLESGALNQDTKGANHLTAGSGVVVADTSDYKSKLAAGTFSNDALGLLDANLSSDFPFKNGNANKDFSFTVWVKSTSGSGNQYFLRKDGSFWVYWYGSRNPYFEFRLFYTTSSYTAYTKGKAIALNKWYHLSFSYNGTTGACLVRIYCPDDDHDVQYSAWTHSTGTIRDTTEPFVFGGYYQGSSFVGDFNGNFDELTIWKKPLDLFEMAEISGGVMGAIAYTHDTELQASHLIYTTQTAIPDPALDCVSVARGCKPTAAMTADDAPLTEFDQDDAPVADIEMDDAPETDFTCETT